MNASDSVELSGVLSPRFPSPSGLFTSTEGRGSGGDLTVNTRQLLVQDGANVSAGTFGEGDAGDLMITAQSVELIGRTDAGRSAGGLFAQVNPGASGDGGNLRIDTGHLLMRDGAQVSASTFGEGDAGDLTVTAQSVEVIGTSANGRFVSGLFTDVTSGARGDGGNLRIDTGHLLVRDGAQVSVVTRGAGKAGDATITAETLTVETGASISATSTAAATAERGGSLTVNASQLNLSGNSGLFASTAGATPAGTLTLRPFGSTPTLMVNLSDGARVSASTSGTGPGGSLIVTAPESVTIRGNGQLAVETNRAGRAGNLNINTQQLTIEDGAQATVSSTGTGEAGNLEVNARNVLLNNQARLAAETEFSSGGNITLDGLDTLKVNNSNISASTESGQAGNIDVKANNIRLDNQAKLTAGSQSGKGGDIKLEGNLNILEVTNSLISASTVSGQAGEIVVNARDSLKLSGSLANGTPGSITVKATGNGTAGSININTTHLTLNQGADISASTVSGMARGITLQGLDTLQVNNSKISAATETGRAGNIDIKARESVLLRGKEGLSVEATGQGGIAGDLILTTRQLTIEDGATINVSSPQGQAGNVGITAHSLSMNRGTITATTAVTSPGQEGANINLKVADTLAMDNESQIEANALEGANGGNVNINTEFLIVYPPKGHQGSDITANAEFGSGGQVNITARGIFGTAFRSGESPLNDITASSKFGIAGSVALNTPNTDPSQGLVELPTDIVDAAGLIDQKLCKAGQESEFIVTGHGGLPDSPQETLNPDVTWEDWRTEDSKQPVGTQLSVAGQTPVTRQDEPRKIVEAQGWIIGSNGKTILTAELVKMTPQGIWLHPLDCQMLRERLSSKNQK